MFVEDLREDFYNVLLGNRVLLLVHYDVDAICTCKILQGLFKCDNISYTLVPVGGVSELKQAYEENNEEVKFVVLVNCGGTIDLVQILQPEEDVVFFVVDAHKPADVCNVYSDGQVRLVHRDDDENIPEFDDIFRDDEEEEDEESSGTRGGALEALAERRRARRLWEERRHTLLFNYTQFSYYGTPSSCVALSLCHVLSRLPRSAVWSAAVGASSCAALNLRPPARLLLDCDQVHQRAASYSLVHDQGVRIVLEKDVCLPLYRCSSVEWAVRHCALLAAPLRMHQLGGANRLRALLADMGFPLQQAGQAYRSMDVELRRSLLPSLETAAAKHRLPSPASTGFVLHRDHSHEIAAIDVVYAILGLIEHETIPKGEGFQLALSALDIDSGDNEARRVGTESAKRTLEAIARLVNGTLAGKRMRLAGPFSYFIVQEGEPESWCCRGPLWLGVAARWAALAGAGSASSSASGGGRPLVVSAPLGPGSAAVSVLGVPPSFLHEPRNLFGAAFEQAAAKSGATVSLDYIDTSIVTLPVQQRTHFLDALTALLA